MTEFEEGGVAGGSCRFCGSLKSTSEMNLSYEAEVSQLTLGGHKGPETLLVGPELADLQDSPLSSSHAEVRPLQVAQHAEE